MKLADYRRLIIPVLFLCVVISFAASKTESPVVYLSAVTNQTNLTAGVLEKVGLNYNYRELANLPYSRTPVYDASFRISSASTDSNLIVDGYTVNGETTLRLGKQRFNIDLTNLQITTTGAKNYPFQNVRSGILENPCDPEGNLNTIIFNRNGTAWAMNVGPANGNPMGTPRDPFGNRVAGDNDVDVSFNSNSTTGSKVVYNPGQGGYSVIFAKFDTRLNATFSKRYRVSESIFDADLSDAFPGKNYFAFGWKGYKRIGGIDYNSISYRFLNNDTLDPVGGVKKVTNATQITDSFYDSRDTIKFLPGSKGLLWVNLTPVPSLTKVQELSASGGKKGPPRPVNYSNMRIWNNFRTWEFALQQ